MDELQYRDNIPIEKGVVLTKNFLDSNQEFVTEYISVGDGIAISKRK